MDVKVIEYIAKDCRIRKTGARVHTQFPAGYVNEELDPVTFSVFEGIYDEILALAEEETDNHSAEP